MCKFFGSFCGCFQNGNSREGRSPAKVQYKKGHSYSNYNTVIIYPIFSLARPTGSHLCQHVGARRFPDFGTSASA